jgi:hypothetical protein
LSKGKKEAGPQMRSGFGFSLCRAEGSGLAPARESNPATRGWHELMTKADVTETQRSPFEAIARGGSRSLGSRGSGGSSTCTARGSGGSSTCTARGGRGLTSRGSASRSCASRGTTTARRGATAAMAEQTMVVMTTTTTGGRAAAGRSPTAIASSTRTTVAAVTGHSNILTADEGDAYDREQNRDSKCQHPIHPRFLQVTGTGT